MFLLTMVPLCRMTAVVFSRNDGIKSRYISPIASPLNHVPLSIWLEILLYGGSSIKNIFIVQIACSKINSGLKTIDLIKFYNLFQKWWLHQQVKVSRKKNLITTDRKFVNFAVWWQQVRQVFPEIYHLNIEKNWLQRDAQDFID